ncbi:hypothetical protein [Undibacterium sp. WLHG33]|jgi:hypothetical protein|uniref:hypothetical protein n=1 Tax=Undibacterium sp. WLHG33 TaxID=3412482 RepID=UPI003C2D664D
MDKKLQNSTEQMIGRFGSFATHMLTLTINDKTNWNISEIAVKKALKYFVVTLNFKMWKHASRKPDTKAKCQIIAIPVCEGMKSQKRVHVHILLGNIPEHEIPKLDATISEIWAKTSIGLERMCLDRLHDLDGAVFYLAKEVGYINNDAVDWEVASIPSVLYTPPKPQLGQRVVG